ncbi:MAG: ScnB [Acidimicrobiales bacterium]
MTLFVSDELLQRAVELQKQSALTDDTPTDRLPSPWATSLQAMCDCLSSHGVVDNVQRRHREDELSEKVEVQLPGELAQLVVVTRMLVEQGIITDQQLHDKMTVVQERFARAD